jgi:hypothetical protein
MIIAETNQWAKKFSFPFLTGYPGAIRLVRVTEALLDSTGKLMD